MASICFPRGTRILTDRGERTIESLRAGMRVRGLQEGTQRIHAVRAIAGRDGLRDPPVRIRAGALGPCVPEADLVLDPNRSVLVGGHLVPVGLLVNDLTILQDGEAAEADWVRIALASPFCLRAAGAWTDAPGGAEVLAEDGAGSAEALTEDRAGSGEASPVQPPRIRDAADPRLPALRSQVTPLLSADDLSPGLGLHLLADGVRIEVTHALEGLWHAVIPAGTRRLRLRSRRTRPSMIDRSQDHRPLGLCVLGLVVETASRRIELALDDPGLGAGFHAVEGAGDSLWRWTDGDAVIPAALLGAVEGPVLLTIRGSHLPLNFIGPDPRLRDVPDAWLATGRRGLAVDALA